MKKILHSSEWLAPGKLIWRILFIFLISLQGLNAQVTYDATSTSSSGTSNVTSLTWSHTTGSGTNRLLVVTAVIDRSSGTNISGITYNGTAMTQASILSNATEATQSAIYYMTNPPSGTYNIVISTGLAEGIIGCGVSFANVCQGTPLGTAVTNNVASTANSSLTVASSPGDYIIDVISLDDLAPTVGAGQTQRQNTGNATVAVYGATSTEAAGTGASTIMNWTFTADSYTHIGIAVKPAAPTGGTASAVPTVAVDAVSTSTSGSNVTSMTWSHTVSGSNKLLVVGCIADGTTNVSSVTYGGISLTNLTRQDNTNELTTAEIWYLVNPPAGTYDIVWTHGASEELIGCGMSFNNVHQSTPLGTAATFNTSATATTASLTVTSGPGDFIVDAISSDDIAAAVGAGQTQRYNVTGTTIRGAFSTEAASAGSSTDMEWSFSTADFYSHVGVAVKPIASAGGVCTGSGVVLSLASSAGTIQWQQNVNGGGWSDITGATTNPYTTSALTYGDSYQYRAVSTACSSTANSTTASVSSISQAATTASAGSDQTICVSTASLAGNSPTLGSGTWTLATGTGTITTPSAYNTGLTGISGVTNIFLWTIVNGACSSSDAVKITYDNPSTANAGTDQTVCSSTATMGATAPANGTGSWSVVSGSGTITSASSNTTTITSLGTGANTFRWTITTSCGTSTDDMIITNNAPTTAVAGSNQYICGTTATMAANTPTIGTGAWSLVSGSGTITTSSSPTTGLTALAAGSNVFRWTITNGSCTSTSDVTIAKGTFSVSAAASPSATACKGADVSLSATMSTSPTATITALSSSGDGGMETGTSFSANSWTYVAGAASTWWVGNYPAPRSGVYSAFVTATVSIGNSLGYNGASTSHFYRDITIPSGATSVTLTFYWRSMSGGPSSDHQMLAYSAPTSVTPVSGTPAAGSTTLTGATLIWTESSSTSGYTLATVDLSSYAGSTLRLIFTWQNGTAGSSTLSGGSPGQTSGPVIDDISLTYQEPVTATYSWTSSPSGFTSGLQNPVATPTINTTYSVVATATSGCTASATVAATVGAGAVPAAVTATVTGSCTSYTITASNGSDGTIYFQNTTSGGTSTADAGNPQTITVSGTYYFRATNGTCWSNQSSSVITIDPDDPTTPVAAANPSCGPTVLNVMVPPAGVTYYWQGTSCGTSTASPTSSTYAVTTTGTYYVRARNNTSLCWSSNCESVAVTIASPTVAANPPNPTAASNPACGSTYLNTMTPPSGEVYYWQGTNSAGTSTANLTLSTYPITTSGTYYVRAVTTDGCWSASSGSIAVTINATPATPAAPTAVANPACATTDLNGTPPASPYIAYWQGTSCGTNAGSDIASAPYTVTSSGVYYVRTKHPPTGCWSACSSVSVTIVPTSSSDAGPDQSLCGSATTTTLAGVSPIYGTGTWSVVSGTATITTPTSATSGVTGLLTSGTATLRWTVANSPCANITDDMVITTSTAAAGTANAGPDQYICSGTTSATMAATGSGTWTKISGAACTITTPTSATTTVTGLASGTYVFRWTSSGCGFPTDDVVITVQ